MKIILGKNQGSPAWFYILVPAHKLADLKAQQVGTRLDVTQFGSMIKYRNKRGEVKPMSGWGTDPPKMIETWIDEHYGK